MRLLGNTLLAWSRRRRKHNERKGKKKVVLHISGDAGAEDVKLFFCGPGNYERGLDLRFGIPDAENGCYHCTLLYRTEAETAEGHFSSLQQHSRIHDISVLDLALAQIFVPALDKPMGCQEQGQIHPIIIIRLHSFVLDSIARVAVNTYFDQCPSGKALGAKYK